MDDNPFAQFENGNRLYLNGRGSGKSRLRGLNSVTRLSGFSDEVLEALDTLDDHLVMDGVHEEEIGQYLEDHEDVAERPGLLVAAGAVPLHEMKQVEYKSFRAYSMGDTVVVEESGEDGWENTATVPYDVAVLVAQARAEQRSRALRMDHDDLRREVNEEIRRRMDDGGGENGGIVGNGGAESGWHTQSTTSEVDSVTINVTADSEQMEDLFRGTLEEVSISGNDLHK